MSRRKFREEKSKFYGAKQVLQDLNIPAHSVVHDLDVGLPSGAGGTGYCLFWSSNTWLRDGDFSPPIYAPQDGTIALAYASLPALAIGDFSVDIYKNGNTIFGAGQNPVILTGFSLSADAIPLTTEDDVVARDVFEVEILSSGGNYGRAMVYITIV